MNVLADYHHCDLYHSLHLLLEKRLGAALYRPIGLDWYDRGFWKYSDEEGVRKQFLELPKEAVDCGSHYEIPDPVHGGFTKAVTLEQFGKMEWEVLMPSVHQNEVAFMQLRNEFNSAAFLVRQAGNIHDVVDTRICPNVLASGIPPEIFVDTNVAIYHQEFDLNVYRPSGEMPENSIYNFQNCRPESRDAALFPKYREALSGYEWKDYGILCEDGILGSAAEIAAEMQKAKFIWHVKFGGDGFGHIIHNAAACGVPLITRAKYYQGLLGGELLEDGKTCIDLDAGTFEENLEKIKFWSEPENYAKMRKAVFARFCEVVDFDKEEVYLREFFLQLR